MGGGVLSSGFNNTPSFLQPYNPDYYQDYFRSAGFDSVKRLPHYTVDLTLPDNAELILNLALKRGIKIRELDKSRFGEETTLVLRILNESFPKLWKYVPFENDEFIEFVRNLRDLIVEGLWLVAEVGDEPVGFVGAFPQCADVFKSASGELEAYDLFLIPQQLKNIKEGAIVLLGVLDNFQGRGIGLQLLAKLCSNMIYKGYRKTTCTWEICDKIDDHPIIEKLGGKKDNMEWSIFGKKIA